MHLRADVPREGEEPVSTGGVERRRVSDAIGAASFILSLRARGVGDTGVLRAMELVPREVFAPRRFADLSRRDLALPLPCGQTMTAPGTVAAMLVRLGVLPGNRVLEVGTGSGYTAALLARLGGQVKTVERFEALAAAAVGHLKAAGLEDGVAVELGDGLAPPGTETFDRILVNGVAPTIPAVLVERLAPKGCLVGAVVTDQGPRLLRIEQTDEGPREWMGSSVRLSPLLAGRSAAL
jgi:protein-L-isoaspartate(D-aspartate) O-methyltransferase